MVRHRPNQAWTRAPLRKVIESGRNDLDIPVERLDCGHIVPTRVDTLGPTHATRRRCQVCRKEREDGERDGS